MLIYFNGFLQFVVHILGQAFILFDCIFIFVRVIQQSPFHSEQVLQLLVVVGQLVLLHIVLHLLARFEVEEADRLALEKCPHFSLSHLEILPIELKIVSLTLLFEALLKFKHIFLLLGLFVQLLGIGLFQYLLLIQFSSLRVHLPYAGRRLLKSGLKNRSRPPLR